MKEKYTQSGFALSYLDDMKKDYRKMLESCAGFEQERHDFCRRIGLDLGAFNIRMHPDYPDPGIFQPVNLSDSDRQVVGEYLHFREKMYLIEQCVRNISDEDTRKLAELYYLQRKPQPEIAAEVGRTKSYVSKRLDKAEKGEMAEAVDRYFEWKYTVPGGRDCYWAGEKEKRYMWQQSIDHREFPRLALPEMPWMKSLRRLGI